MQVEQQVTQTNLGGGGGQQVRIIRYAGFTVGQFAISVADLDSKDPHHFAGTVSGIISTDPDPDTDMNLDNFKSSTTTILYSCLIK